MKPRIGVEPVRRTNPVAMAYRLGGNGGSRGPAAGGGGETGAPETLHRAALVARASIVRFAQRGND